VPISAVAVRADIAQQAHAYVASTYSGHPAGCAAGIKTLEILQRDGLIERATTLGEEGLARLRLMKDSSPIVGDVRGKGLWLAVEFVADRASRRKNYEAARAVNRACLENGLYCIQDGDWFLRIQPPLNIERGLFHQGLDILEEAIRKVGSGRAPAA
jgi:4-aminobutyrate aminotransferase/(S)-3-amino-2-methylpropionate transaminase